MKQTLFLIIILFALIFNKTIAQSQTLVNTNYLIEYGISPRVLDAAASWFMQDGRFSNDVEMIISKDGKEKKYDLTLIYDPEYELGMDVRVVSKSGKLTGKEQKALRKYIEASHYFSRMSRDYLYDESTLKLIEKNGDNLVLEFYYQKNDIDQYLRNIKRLKGEIHITDGKLDKVILINTKPLKKHITDYKKIVRYAKVDGGGYIITSIEESILSDKGGHTTRYRINSTTLSYGDTTGKEVIWENRQSSENLSTGRPDTINVKLGGPLPLLGKAATKLGYQLPRPIGVAAFIYIHDQFMEFTGLSVGINGGEKINLDNLFYLNESNVVQSSDIYLAKADVWVFPFLNVMAIVGGGQNDIDAQLVINEDLRDFINNLPGWIIDLPYLPESIPVKTSVRSEIYGLGATLAGGVGSFNLSVNYQLMFTKIVEANTTNMVNVITPMVGYMAPFGVNFMLGAQGQFYNTQITGFFEFENNDGENWSLDYIVDFEPIKWNAIIGFYKGFSKHWEMSIQAGFGQRTSVTAVFGYRF